MRIRLIIPITGLTGEGIEERLSYLNEIADPGTEVEAVQVEVGPPAIESEADAVLAGPDVLRLVREAERDGVDVAIIWCGGDPALAAARELVDIPVIGPGPPGGPRGRVPRKRTERRLRPTGEGTLKNH